MPRFVVKIDFGQVTVVLSDAMLSCILRVRVWLLI